MQRASIRLTTNEKKLKNRRRCSRSKVAFNLGDVTRNENYKYESIRMLANETG